MTKRILLVLLACLTIGVQAFAQTVSGKVTDANGEAIPGASVLVKGTTTGSMTDLDGVYQINAGTNATLVFSCIGFTSKEVTVASQKQINVVLDEDSALLDEVVVVGYGTARKKDISGAIQSLNFASNENLANLPNPNALSALSSRIAGFSYAPTSSASGDNTNTMTIRGKNVVPVGGAVSSSAASVNKPLLIIDGVISNSSINEINTSDIESVDVLKDASAAAIYGSRAANGVIIITTKSGSSEKPTVRLNASVSVSDWSRRPQMVTDEATFFRNRMYSKAQSNEAWKSMDWATFDKAQLFNSDVEKKAYDQGVRTDWIDEISRKGVGQKYDLSVGGKAKNVSYYVSGDYTRQEGVRKGDDYEKFNALGKVDINVFDWLTVGAKGNFISSSSWGTTARIQNATWMSPYSFVHAIEPGYEDWYNSKPDGNTVSPLYGTATGDSYLWTDYSSKGDAVTGVTYAQIDFPFLKGLSYRITLQGRHSNNLSDQFTNPEFWVDTYKKEDMNDPSKFAGDVEGKTSTSKGTYWNIDNILTYAKDIKKHHFDIMLGYTREKSVSEGFSNSFKGFDTPTYLGVYSQGAAAKENMTPARTRTESSSIAYLARVNYNYANKYYVSGNFRRDGYSAFADGRKWGNFFGASAAWVLSNEDFIKDNATWIDFLKLRVSWGQNGSRAVSPYYTLATVAAAVNNGNATTHTWLGNKQGYGVYLQNLPNHELTWATVEKADLGVDFSFFGGRLNGSIDGYIGNTKNMLVLRSAPYVTGFSDTYDNVGKISNNGIEVSVNSVNFAGNGRDSFRWETNLVFDSNSNKIESLYGPNADGEEKNDVANYLAYGSDSYYALQIGRPIGSAYDFKLLGIFQDENEIAAHKVQPNAKPGDLKFEDINNDGKIDDNDRTYIGTGDPLFTLNLANTLSWKGFSLYFNFRWCAGDKEHFLGADPFAFNTNMGSGAQLASVKPWCNEEHWKNTDTVYPRYGYPNNPQQDSNYYLFYNSRGFLKLKDLSLSYNIPEKAVRTIGLQGIRVYAAATDLFTITKWSGLDPETGGTIAAGAGSSRYGSNGTYKTMTFGVNLTF